MNDRPADPPRDPRALRVKILLGVQLLVAVIVASLTAYAGFIVPPALKERDTLKGESDSLKAQIRAEQADVESKKNELKANVQQIDAAVVKLNKIHESLDAAKSGANDRCPPQVRQAIDEALGIADASRQSLGESLSQATSSVGTPGSPVSWAVVFGGDKTLAAAAQEIRKAVAFPAARIVLKQGSYRSVVLFPDRVSAQKALPGISSFSYTGYAYVVDFSGWCANPHDQTEQGQAFLECGSK